MDFLSLKVLASGLKAERIRLNTIASNIANIESYTRNGKPFRRLEPVFKAIITDKTFKEGVAFVKVERIITSRYPVVKIYDPSNPFSDKKGYIEKPNISLAKEMSDLITATRIYQANLQAYKLNRDLIINTIDMWKWGVYYENTNFFKYWRLF